MVGNWKGLRRSNQCHVELSSGNLYYDAGLSNFDRKATGRTDLETEMSFEQVRTRLNKIWKWEGDQKGREVLIAGKIFTAQAGLGFGFRPPPSSCPSPAAGRGWGRGDSAHPVGPPIAQSHLCTSVRAYAQQRAVAFVTEHSSFEGVLPH